MSITSIGVNNNLYIRVTNHKLIKMNTRNYLKQLFVLAVAAVGIAGCGSSKEAANNMPVSKETITAAAQNNEWTFTVNQIRPQSGRSRNPNGLYTASMSKDKLLVQLPYFGRAFAGADVMSNQGVLDFTSTDFTVDKQQKKEDQWIVTIVPKDQREVQSMVFTIYDNGYGDLYVRLTNRSPISFTGSYTAKKL
jgi:uncharacterized lipoprotein YajG